MTAVANRNHCETAMLRQSMNHLAILSQRRFLYFVIFLSLWGLSLFASGGHDRQFWRSILERDFTAPPNESIAHLALEIVDLTAETDPILRDKCGYEILATWVYREGCLSGDELEALRRKLLPGMTFHIGESESGTVFRRSFSALYMSILAAQDLQKPFLSEAAFQEMLATALRCYANERDLRGYVPKKGWAHATAHVADLLKFLARNPKLSSEGQKSIVVLSGNAAALKILSLFGVKTHESPPRCYLSSIGKISHHQPLMAGSKR